jgi:hypothetical protein
MLKGIAFKLIAVQLLITASILKSFSQDLKIPFVRFMFYNVENLFDIYDDTLTEDDDFLPAGVMRWNYSRYNRKINSLYKTIVAAGDWTPPALIAMCEIENRRVIEDLLYQTNLSKYGYGIIHEESPDERGIDVSLIYRKEIVKKISSRYWIPSGSAEDVFKSRSVLYAKCLIRKDTVHIFVNHWPSRRGGVLAGEYDRIRIASLIRSKVDSIAMADPSGPKILITGDFNCTPEDPIIKRLTSPASSGFTLVNLSDSLSQEYFGTYRFGGTWEMLDQVIVSGSLFISKAGLSAETKNLRIFKPDFLLKNDPNYPGQSPFSTYRGYRYQGGFSDHLPVLLDLEFR